MNKHELRAEIDKLTTQLQTLESDGLRSTVVEAFKACPSLQTLTLKTDDGGPWIVLNTGKYEVMITAGGIDETVRQEDQELIEEEDVPQDIKDAVQHLEDGEWNTLEDAEILSLMDIDWSDDNGYVKGGFELNREIVLAPDFKLSDRIDLLY